MARTAMEEEEEEIWAGWIFLVQLFRVETLLNSTNFFGISFGYPFRPR